MFVQQASSKVTLRRQKLMSVVFRKCQLLGMTPQIVMLRCYRGCAEHGISWKRFRQQFRRCLSLSTTHTSHSDTGFRF